MSSTVGSVVLRQGRARMLKRSGHPLIYQKSIVNVNTSKPNDLKSGDPILIKDFSGEVVGWGVYNSHSLYSVRVLEMQDAAVKEAKYCNIHELNSKTEKLIQNRIYSAVAARWSLGFPSTHTTAFRVINAEGDGLSGITVDQYGPNIVVLCTAAWIRRWKELIIDSLLKYCRGAEDVIWRDDKTFMELEGVIGSTEDEMKKTQDLQIYEGSHVLEENIKFLVFSNSGQKTGHYCDQRCNRRIVREISAVESTSRILDLCCFTGGFSINAALGGANAVVGVDSSEVAINMARENAILNNVDHLCTFIRSNIEDYMKTLIDKGDSEKFDLIILDPPKLAPSKRHLSKALHKYRRLNTQAMRLLRNGGLLFTFSCSGIVAADSHLVKVVEDAAKACRKKVRILSESSAAPDHPISTTYPEGKYLTALLLTCEDD